MDDDGPELTFSSTFSVRIVAHEPFFEAIAQTERGESVLFAALDGEGKVIAVVNEAKKPIGVLPSTDPLAPRLRRGERYRARVLKVARGADAVRFRHVVVEVTMLLGTLSS